MSFATGFAVYFIVWWLVLFTTLPFGVRSQHDERAAGTDPGAPVKSLMLRKLIATTAISAVLYGAGVWANRAGYLTVERLSQLIGM